MTIYSQVNGNKLKSLFLVLFFIAFFSFVFFIIGKAVGNSSLYFTIGLVFSLASGIGSYFFSDKLVLASTGAKPANKKEHFNFYTVAENVSIASGLPMPRLYVIDDPSPNAFATGRDPKHAVVAATTGLLNKLNRTELEGVIAHEFSHIKNYDILVSSLVAVLAGTLVFVVDWVMRGLWWGGLDDDNRNMNPLIFVFLILTLIISPIIATLIQLAISRKREYLADASGALITRNPDSLADALLKIASDPQPLRRASGGTAHLFIESPFKKKKARSFFSSLFSTHPPTDERVRILHEM